MKNELGIESPVVRMDVTKRQVKKSLNNVIEEDTYLHNRLISLADEINNYKSEGEFRMLFNKHRHYSTARRLRLQFWSAYNNVINSKLKNQKLSLSMIHAGICSETIFRKLLKDDLIATFIMTQPHDVKMIQRDILYEGYKYLEEIMMLPITDENGNPNNSLIAHKIKIINMMEDRVNGSVVQRSQTYSEQVSKFEGNAGDDPKQLESLRDEINLLKKNLGKEIEEADFREIRDKKQLDEIKELKNG